MTSVERDTVSTAAPRPSVQRYVPAFVRQAVFARDHGRCVACHVQTELVLERVIPRQQGGEDTVDNLHVLCRSCAGLSSEISWLR